MSATEPSAGERGWLLCRNMVSGCGVGGAPADAKRGGKRHFRWMARLRKRRRVHAAKGKREVSIATYGNRTCKGLEPQDPYKTFEHRRGDGQGAGAVPVWPISRWPTCCWGSQGMSCAAIGSANRTAGRASLRPRCCWPRARRQRPSRRRAECEKRACDWRPLAVASRRRRRPAHGGSSIRGSICSDPQLPPGASEGRTLHELLPQTYSYICSLCSALHTTPTHFSSLCFSVAHTSLRAPLFTPHRRRHGYTRLPTVALRKLYCARSSSSGISVRPSAGSLRLLLHASWTLHTTTRDLASTSLALRCLDIVCAR